MGDRTRGRRGDYLAFVPLTTRWADNDVYGHINNVTYYALVDTAVNQLLIEQGLLDIERSDVIGVVAESGCRYHASAAYPDRIEAGVRVGRLGSSSVRYEVGLFRQGEDEALAEAHFVHVYVQRQSMRPTPIAQGLRDYLTGLVVMG